MSPQLVLGPSGVLQGIRPGKCYVDMSTVDADTVTELAQVVASFGLALQHPFSWSPRPRLTMPKCGQLSYSRAKARDFGTSLSSLSAFKSTASLSGCERRLVSWLGWASGPIAASLSEAI